MTLLALTWPDAIVLSSGIVTAGLVVAVVVWQIFATGRTAMKHERREA